MKKPLPKRDHQYWPFDDFRPPFVVGFEDPKIGDLPWQTLAEGIKTRGRTKDSIALTHLVDGYRKKVKQEGEDKALAEFWSLVGNLAIKEPSKEELKSFLSKIENKNVRKWLRTAKPIRGLSFVTNEMRLFLYQAWAGEIEAAQIIVRACPEAIFLPFIAKTMTKIVIDHKYGEKKRIDKNAWKGFLPKRRGGMIPLAKKYQKLLLRKIAQQDKRPLISTKEGIPSLCQVLGEKIGVSASTLKNEIKGLRKRGRRPK